MFGLKKKFVHKSFKIFYNIFYILFLIKNNLIKYIINKNGMVMARCPFLIDK